MEAAAVMLTHTYGEHRYNISDTKLKFHSILESHIQETFTGELRSR